jgi:hypothetical protein
MQKDCGFFPPPSSNIQSAMKIFKSTAHPTFQLTAPICASESLTDIPAWCLIFIF